MNTKIVYVVASDETDFYLEQTLLSVFSLRKHNPDAYVELVVDQDTDTTITGKKGEILKYVDNKVVVNVRNIIRKRLLDFLRLTYESMLMVIIFI